MKHNILLTFMLLLGSLNSWAGNDPFADASRSYTLPTLTKNNEGVPVLYWTEKDDKNVVYLYLSTSRDGGKTFADKKLIYADAGLGNGRLARPKLLFKKDGEMVAVFSYRSGGVMPPPAKKPETMTHEGGHANHGQIPSQSTPPAARPKRESQIRYTVSKDNGTTWTSPISVDSDTTRLTRGFFDAVVLANDEIAVAYLKDVKGSKKHEERDLRMVITKSGTFQDEKLIDPVVCDCCNISLMLDNKGLLNVFYRDNNNDIRDIARLTSANNGGTFSKSEILHNDKWEIKGCPHAGATSVATANGALITWFSGTPENTGVRLVNSEGKLLKVLGSTAKNAHLSADSKQAVYVWEQTAESGVSNILFNKIKADNLADNQIVKGSEYGQNPTSLVLNGKILLAYEIAKPNQKTALIVQVLE